MRRRLLPLAILTALAAGATATQASATTLYATPTATGAFPCAQQAPCPVAVAMQAATSGDDVAIAPGDYYAAGTTPFASLPDVKSGVSVHGTPGLPLPVLHGLTTGNAAPLVRVQTQSSLSDVAIDSTPAAGLIYAYGVSIDAGGILEQSIVRMRGNGSTYSNACSMTGGWVRSSACLGSGPGTVNGISAAAGTSATYQVRNVTAITTADSGSGVRLGVASGASTMLVTNTIARGVTADLEVRTGQTTGSATMTVDHSNWNAQSTGGPGNPRIVQGEGNQYGPTTAVPLFVNAAAGDYRVAAGSPTIDAGATDPLNGTLALGGAARTVGAATDIGAYEFVPPSPTPAPPAPPTTPGASAPPAAPPVSAADTRAPVLGGLTIGRSWRLSSTVRFTLSEPAKVTLTFSRPAAGRRSAGRCRPALTTHRGPRCTIANVRGSIVVSGKAGPNALRVSRTIAGKRTLKPGGYSLSARPVDPSGNRGTARTARFTIAR